jgi:hypothetical protein
LTLELKEFMEFMKVVAAFLVFTFMRLSIAGSSNMWLTKPNKSVQRTDESRGGHLTRSVGACEVIAREERVDGNLLSGLLEWRKESYEVCHTLLRRDGTVKGHGMEGQGR